MEGTIAEQITDVAESAVRSQIALLVRWEQVTSVAGGVRSAVDEWMQVREQLRDDLEA